MLESLNLRQLRAVVAILRSGSISAAAQAVNISQPAITQGLSKLESQLGVPLFYRQPDGMQPTEEAKLLVPRVERAMEHIGSRRATMAQMRALLALAEAGSYASASSATGLSQPTLHRAVADLSIVLRRKLVERRGKGVGFTESGRRSVRSFRLARAELLAGLAEIKAMEGREVKGIAVGAMPLSRARVLPAAISAFLAGHPDVRIVITEGSFGELIEPLRDGDLDLMMGALRDPCPGDDVQQEALFFDRPAIIGRKGHPLSDRMPSMADFADYPWVVSPQGTPLYGQWRSMFDQAGLPLPAVPVECGSVIAIRQLLIASDFLTLLSPDQVAIELTAECLVKIADAPAGLTRTIGMTTRTGWRPTPLQAAFVEQLRIASGDKK